MVDLILLLKKRVAPSTDARPAVSRYWESRSNSIRRFFWRPDLALRELTRRY
jgi:hypothetical protein